MIIQNRHSVSQSPSRPQQTNYKSLNDKMMHIERVLQKMRQQDQQDSQHLQHLIQKSQQLQQRTLEHIGRCDSVKTILNNPPSDDPDSALNLIQSVKSLRRSHSLETHQPLQAQAKILTSMRRENKSSRLNFLNKHIDNALGQLQNVQTRYQRSRVKREQQTLQQHLSSIHQSVSHSTLPAAAPTLRTEHKSQSTEYNIKLVLLLFVVIAVMIWLL